MSDPGGIPFTDERAYDALPSGRTGAYRVRRGLFRKAILQFQWKSLRSPSNGGGYEIGWMDEDPDRAPYVLVFDTPWFQQLYKRNLSNVEKP